MSVRVRIATLLVGAVVVAFAAVGIPALGAQPHDASARTLPAAASKGYSAKLSYDETNPGKQRGSALLGIQGHGAFSAKLGANAALEAAVIALATGVPVTKIAKGGSYSVQRDIAGSSAVSGTAVVTFRAHGLGTLCVSFSAKPGRFVPGQSFVPLSGTLRAAGGTGAAAHWKGSVAFKQTSVSGMAVEQFGMSGSEQGSVGKARGLTAACRKVAALKR
ncbi:MAG TPA: hypothetical protein VIL82_08250 [Solirubrobacteraceae bacterium]|jgi:hypothetical protein